MYKPRRFCKCEGLDVGGLRACTPSPPVAESSSEDLANDDLREREPELDPGFMMWSPGTVRKSLRTSPERSGHCVCDGWGLRGPFRVLHLSLCCPWWAISAGLRG